MGLFHKLTFIDALEILDCSSLSEQQKKKVIKAESHFTEDEKTACNMLLCLHKDDGMALALLIINLINRENLPGEINAALYTHIAFRKFSEAHEKDPSKPDYIAYLALAYEHGSFCCEKDHSKAVEMAEPLRSSEATGALVKQALKDIFPEGADSAASDNKSADTPESEKANAAAIADTESTSPVVPSAAKGSSDKSAQQAEFKRLEIDGGDVFEGYFLNEKKNGHGKYIWANGDIFDGNWVDGKRTGKGKVTWSNGASFDGEWKDNQMSEGKYTFPDGKIYDGSFQNGKKHGRGTCTWTNGDSYEGEWKDNQMSGQGRYTFASGSYYEGTLENDSFEGNGKRVYAGGDVYEGQWHEDKRSGRGTYTWADGTYYEGEFADGNFNGFGKKVYSSGDVYEGQWKDDKRTGKGRITWSNGDTYEGDWRDGERCGRGKLIQYGKSPSGETYMKYSYDGEWLDSKEHGHGICVEGDFSWFKNDKVLEGEWVNGKRQGRFVWYLTNSKGGRYMDFYEDGNLIETCIPYDGSIKTVEDARRARALADGKGRSSAVARTTTTPAAAPSNLSADGLLSRYNSTFILDFVSENPAFFRADYDNENLNRAVNSLKKGDGLRFLFYVKRSKSLSMLNICCMELYPILLKMYRIDTEDIYNNLVRRLVYKNNLADLSCEDAEYCLYLFDAFIPHGRDYEAMARCYYRLGDVKSAARWVAEGPLYDEIMAFRNLQKAQNVWERGRYAFNEDSKSSFADMADDRLVIAEKCLSRAQKSGHSYRLGEIQEQASILRSELQPYLR